MNNENSNEQVILARERTALAQERNRFANERTYLAWLRTGLACVGGGVAVIRLLTFETPSHVFISEFIGSVLVILGILIFTVSFWNYYKYYEKNNILKSVRGSLGLNALITTVLIIVSLLLLAIAFH